MTDRLRSMVMYTIRDFLAVRLDVNQLGNSSKIGPLHHPAVNRQGPTHAESLGPRRWLLWGKCGSTQPFNWTSASRRKQPLHNQSALVTTAIKRAAVTFQMPEIAATTGELWPCLAEATRFHAYGRNYSHATAFAIAGRRLPWPERFKPDPGLKLAEHLVSFGENPARQYRLLTGYCRNER